MRVSAAEFDDLVARALDQLPEEFSEILENIVVVVEDSPSTEDLLGVGLDPACDDLLGLYQGVPQVDRDTFYSSLPDRVVLYREPILSLCTSRRQAVREIRDTLIHELGHHFGLDDEEMPY
ncbi:MAG: metallopeptidase family protein [Acidobacteriota bacterium]|nr:metallopeptidase family protein [Acidobacteriota bacterium]